MKKRRLSDDYLYVIYDPLLDKIRQSAKVIYNKFFANYAFNLYKYFDIDDLCQIGLAGILDMDDGLPISVYHSRAKNRMMNFVIYRRRQIRDDRMMLHLIDYANSKND